ncbi:phage tail tape measure protein [Frigidibacter sp. MR17.24]|uniref:phage tail tape measure protein n=1 Tax=Frigidibacter sp. MR17.24 TaxID=3127345 RepID=UPI003012C4D6
MAESLSYAMTANIMQLEQSAKKAQQVVAQTHATITREFSNSNAKVTAGLSDAGTSMARFGQVTARQQQIIQNTSYQFADLAVQIGSGTSVLRALGQQLPQILGPLGTFGALAGVAAAVLLPLASAMGGSEDAAKTLDGAIKSVEQALSDYRAATDFANTSTEEMEKRFGVAAKGVSAIAKEIQSIRAEQAQRAIDGLAGSLASMMGTAGDGDLRQGIAGFFDQNIGFAFTAAQKEARAEARQLTSEFVRQQDAIAGATGDVDAQIAATQALLSVTISLAEAKDGISAEEDAIITKITEALQKMVDQKEAMLQASGAAASMQEPMAKVAEGADGILAAVNLIPPALAASTDGANGLAAAANLAASNFAAAARNAAAVAEAQRQAGVQIGSMNSGSAYAPGRAEGVGDASVVFGPRPTPGAAPSRSIRPQRPDVNSFGDFLDGGRSSQRGGGRSKRETDSVYEQEIQRFTRQIELIGKTSEQVAFLEAKWKLLDEAKAKGLTVGDALNAQIEAQAQKIGDMAVAQEKAADRAQMLTQFQSDLKSGLIDGIVAGDGFAGAMENVAQSLARAALQAAFFNEGIFASGSGKGLLGGLFGSIFGGGAAKPYAKGGVQSGPGISAYSGRVVSRPTLFPFANGTGLMGEAGPEAILPLARAANGKLGVQAQGGGSAGSTTIHQTFVVQGNGDEFIRREMAKQANTIKQQTIAGVIEAKKRGTPGL